MTIQSAKLAAGERRETRLRAYAHEHFPGITDLTPRLGVSPDSDTNDGSGKRELIGSWHGVWVGFAPTDAGARAAMYSLCSCCGRFAITFGRCIPEAEALATAEIEPAEIARCYSCIWLHDAQAAATTRQSRFARWRFTQKYGVSVADVLARHTATPRH